MNSPLKVTWGSGREGLVLTASPLSRPTCPPIPVVFGIASVSYLVLAGESTNELLDVLGFGAKRSPSFHWKA